MSTITSLPPAAVAGAARSERVRHWLPLAVVLTGTFMSVLDFFIVNVALPDMQRSLHASASELEWTSAGYALATAVLLVASGRLGDRFGRRATFATGLAVFTIGSAACGLAPSATTLVIGRIVQGVGGAMLATNVMSLLGVLYVDDERTVALSAYAAVMGVAAIGGQLIGGALLALDPAGLGWRSVFLINLPIGVAGVLAAIRLVPESRGEARTLDPLGIALITGGLVALVLPLVEGRQFGWPLWGWLSLGAAPVIFAAFVLQQLRLGRRGGAPLLELGLFRRRAFAAGMLTQMAFWVGQASFFLILALYLQGGRGLSPIAAGGVFAILAVSYVFVSMRAPALAIRHGRTVITAAGLTLAAAHLLLIGAVALVGTGGSVLALAPGLIAAGVGMGLGIGPLTANLLATLRPEQAGAAAGALATAQFVGNAIGVAVVGVAFFGALHGGYAPALQAGLAVLAGVLALVAVLSRALPAAEAAR